MATNAPMKPMKRSRAPVANTTRATKAPSIEVMKFFMKHATLPAFGPSTSRNRRFEEVTQERVASPRGRGQCAGHEWAKGSPDDQPEGAHDQPRPPKYGTFAEIGAGQEVAREFFQAGGASGTIAKSISAYDMVFSDAIYGKAPRYVSRERLKLMLDHEYQLLIDRLSSTRGERTNFFVFADTVATSSYKGTNEAHGWLGFRFQTEPKGEPSEIVLHVRMWDKEAVLQQQALGIVGVNFIYGALYYRSDLAKLIESLRDNLGMDRIEIDMLRFSGPAFESVDNRLMSLFLVKFGLTNAVMFGQKGEVLQPSEVLYKKAILVERGSFRPVTHVNVDMLNCATAQFIQEPSVKGKGLVVLMEITMNNLLAAGSLDAQDFLSRVDLLADIGFTVLISNYSEYYRLTSYFRRYTKEMIGVAMGVNNLLEIFNEKYYENLEGGILESFGRLFRNSVKLYIYPMRKDAYEMYIAQGGAAGRLDGDERVHLQRPHQFEERQDRRPPGEPLRPPSREPLHRQHRRLRRRHPEHLLARRPAPHQGEGPRLGDDGARHPSPRPSSGGACSGTRRTRSSRATSSMRFHKYHALGNDYVVLDPAEFAAEPAPSRPRSA